MSSNPNMNIKFKSELGLLFNLGRCHYFFIILVQRVRLIFVVQAELYLNGANAMGEIPSEIGLLQKLTILDLTKQYEFSEGFASSIPSEIGKLSLLGKLLINLCLRWRIYFMF
jgi:hypothetical protein